MQTLHLALSTASAGWPCPTQHCTSRRPRPVHAWHAWPTGVRQQAPTAVASLADARRCDQLTQTPAMTLAAPLDAADPAAATTARLPAARPSLRSQPSRRCAERAALTSARPLGCQEPASSCAARRFTGAAWRRAARRARPPTLPARAGAPGAAHGFFGRGRASTSRAVGAAPAAALLAGTGKAWPGGACRRGAAVRRRPGRSHAPAQRSTTTARRRLALLGCMCAPPPCRVTGTDLQCW